MERLAQSETYYPGYQEPDSGVTAVAFGICRMTDGFWYDFNDSTFKNSGWTTQHQTMTEDANGFWLYTTGWAIPDSNSIYQIQWKVTDATGTFYSEGTKIVINSALLDKLTNLPPGIAKNVALSNFEYLMIASANHISVKTGLTITGTISQDGGAFVALTNASAEVGNGVYKVDLTQAEMNADFITLKFTAVGADQRTISIKTSA